MISMKSPTYLSSLVTLCICYLFSSCASTQYDLIIRNGEVFDGSNTALKKMDIAIKDDKIIQLAPHITASAKKEIDASGLVVAPGFIDVHVHLEPLMLIPDAESHVRQGVTTAFGGLDGSSEFPLGAYMEGLDSLGVGLNVGYFIGHNTIRNHVMGMENRVPTVEELKEMENYVANAMQSGAFGLSTGLKYLPGAWAETDEVVALSKVAASHGGIYASHMREEGLGLIDAVKETIDIARLADIPVIISHHKAIGKPSWGKCEESLALVDAARAEGYDVMMDQYPYTASHTSLNVLIPPWAMEGGRYKAFAKRCEDPILRDSIKRGIVYNILNDRGGGDLKRIQFSKFDWKPELGGKTLHDWAIQENMEPNAENGAELVIQAQLHRGAHAIYHAISPEDVKRIMQHPQAMVASDGRISLIDKGHPHPRVYGTFPRVLGHYVRDEKVIPLELALYKMTGLPAQRMGLRDRGFIKEDYQADITIFDANSIKDKATFENPNQYPVGIHYVLINGKVVLEKEKFNALRAGEVLRRE